jgi:hypothetical protein
MVSLRGGIDRAFLEFHYLPDTRLSLLYFITGINALEHNLYLSTTFLLLQLLDLHTYLFRLDLVCIVSS